MILNTEFILFHHLLSNISIQATAPLKFGNNEQIQFGKSAGVERHQTHACNNAKLN